MTLKELAKIRRTYLDKYAPYKLTYWREFKYKLLSNILYRKKAGQGDNNTYNEVIIMCDTETSKKKPNEVTILKDGSKKYKQVDNHVCAWTISLRALNRNIVTLYGHKPSSMCECIGNIISHMKGFETFFYWHNMAYDWVFIRKFMFQRFGLPEKQLNTKSHYPILIKWSNGITFKDSLILAQRSLEKWADDMDVEHKKAVGYWDYDKIRSQREEFTPEELEYIEHDTLAGVECIDKLRIALNKSIYSMPYTATGIPREEVRTRGSKHGARDNFKRQALTYEQYLKAEQIFHGGFTHANRHLIDVNIDFATTKCADFASSYPYVMISEKFPSEKFFKIEDKPKEFILEHSSEYAFMFKLILVKPKLKNDFITMPALQFSKCLETINAVLDNGRILCADYAEILITENDLFIIDQQYEALEFICTDIEISAKEYLPRWFTDYVFECFTNKCKLKGGDPVAYALSKSVVNSLFGMCAQKSIKDNLAENYLTGEYKATGEDPEELYKKYLSKRTSILPYQWSLWITSYSFRNLFELGACSETWIYSDTDSCYSLNWDEDKLAAYNQQCKEKLLANNYGPVIHEGREFWLGVAESEPLKDEYSEFKVQGAKRYCARCLKDNELHITVAGVPKKGAKCLNNDINKFTKGFIFPGTETGKLTHTYNYVEEIYIDENGNETGDSIDLTPCDYELDKVEVVDWEKLLEEEIQIQIYEEDIYINK